MAAQTKDPHGWTEEQILNAIHNFESKTKDWVQKAGSWSAFNELVLRDDPAPPDGLKNICKGLFVGRIFLRDANSGQPYYLVATCKNFIIMVPTGPIQSIIHLLAVPKIPIYNAVSLDIEKHSYLLLEMQAGLRKVVSDILKPGSDPRKLYMKLIKKAISCKESDRKHIRIVQAHNNLDTTKTTPEESIRQLNDVLDKYYESLGPNADTEIMSTVNSDLHLHDSASVGQLHMHGWVSAEQVISDNGRILKKKNTPLDRILPVLYKARNVNMPNIQKKPRAVVKDKLKKGTS